MELGCSKPQLINWIWGILMGIDLSNKKFFVESGCSYGRLTDSLFNVRNKSEQLYHIGIDVKKQLLFESTDEVIFINVSGASQGSDWQSDSIIYTIGKLLELGAKPWNIYCHVEFSEIGRISFPIDKGMEIPTDWLNWKKFQGDTSQGIYQFNKGVHKSPEEVYQGFTIETDLVKYLQDNIQIYADDNISVGKIEDTEYFCVESWHDSRIKEHYEFELTYTNYKNALYSLPQEFFVQRYIDNILKTQFFLKSKNIKYNFSQIYSQFSGWYKFPDESIRQFHIHDSNNWKNDMSLLKERFPKNKSLGIEEVFPSIYYKFKEIDFNKFWTYEDETSIFDKAGIDEYMLDTYGPNSYVQTLRFANEKSTWDSNEWPIECSVGVTGHPDVIFYFLMFNKLTKDCDFFSINENILNKLEKARIKDRKSDTFSESKLFCSDKWVEMILNNTLQLKEYKKFIEYDV